MEKKTKTSIASLFNTKRFYPLFCVQFLGAFNDNFFKNALIILIMFIAKKETNIDSKFLVTIASGIFILPFFLFSATAGIIADKYEKSKLIRIIKFIEILIMTLALIGFSINNINILMVVLFLMGTQSAFFGPIKYSILPEHLEKNELMPGNAIISAATFVSILAGTIAGGILVSYEYVVGIVAIIIAIIGYLSSRYIPETKNQDKELKLSFNFIKETHKIVKEAKKHRTVLLSILGISWAWFIGATFLTQLPSYIRESLHYDKSVATLFLATFSIAVGLGSITCNKLTKGFIDATYVPIAALMIGIFTIDLFFTTKYIEHIANTNLLMTIDDFLKHPSQYRILIDCFFIAFFSGVYMVPLYVILQAKSPKESRSRTIAANNIINALFMVCSAVYCALMLKFNMTSETIFLVQGIVSIIIAFYIIEIIPEALPISILRGLLTLFFKVEVKNLETIKNENKRYIFIANHTSYIDAILLAVFTPKKLTFAINTKVANKWWVKPFLSFVDIYMIEPSNPFAIKDMIKTIKEENKSLVIFPEGRISRTGSLMKIYQGPGLIADKSETEILPVKISGAKYTIFSYLKGKVKRSFFPKITLEFQEPQKFIIPKEYVGRKKREIASNMLYDIMTNMMIDTHKIKKTIFQSLIDTYLINDKSKIALEDYNREPVTYEKLILKSFVLGRTISRHLKNENNIGLMLPNLASSTVVFFGLQAYNKTPAMLNYTAGKNNLLSACITAELKTILTSKVFVEKANLEDVIEFLRSKDIEIIYLEDFAKKVSIIDKINGLISKFTPNFSYRLINKGKLSNENNCAILFTSGSEGKPKGVVLSHKNIQTNISQVISTIDFEPNDRIFNALPIFHSFGLTAGLLLPLLNGAKVFLHPTPLHYRIVPELVYDTNSTIMFGTDTFLRGYAKFANPYDFYSTRYVIAGAEKVKNETRQIWLEKFGTRILEGYGATETSPIISVNTPMYNKKDSVGRIIPAMEYKVESIEGIENGGKLLVKGNNVMKGYILEDNPNKILPPENGWYDTGDIVEIDENKFITIKGRAKRFAKVGGEMVSLTAVEDACLKVFKNQDYNIAAIAVNDDKKGEKIIVYTTLKELNSDNLKDNMKQLGFNEISYPKEVIFIENIPLLGTGKTDYQSVKKLYN